MFFLAPQYTFAIYDSVSSNLSNIVLEVDMSSFCHENLVLLLADWDSNLEGLDWMSIFFRGMKSSSTWKRHGMIQPPAHIEFFIQKQHIAK